MHRQGHALGPVIYNFSLPLWIMTLHLKSNPKQNLPITLWSNSNLVFVLLKTFLNSNLINDSFFFRFVLLNQKEKSKKIQKERKKIKDHATFLRYSFI